MFTCAFCKKSFEKLHPSSHVIAKWIYREISAEKNAALQISTRNLTADKVQSSFNGAFLCESCETVTSKYDRYGSHLFKTNTRTPLGLKKATINCGGLKPFNLHQWSNINFHQLQKFIFSIILRADCYYKLIQKPELFSEEHFEGMLALYLDNVGKNDSDYPINIHRIVGMPLIIMPIKDYIDGHHIIRAACATFYFEVCISNHPRMYQGFNMRLQQDGKLSLMEFGYSQLGILTAGMTQLKKIDQLHGKKIRKLFNLTE